MIGFFEEAEGTRSMTRLCVFLLTLGMVSLDVVVAILALRAQPDEFVVKIVECLVGAIATVTGGIWAALHERN